MFILLIHWKRQLIAHWTAQCGKCGSLCARIPSFLLLQYTKLSKTHVALACSVSNFQALMFEKISYMVRVEMFTPMVHNQCFQCLALVAPHFHNPRCVTSAAPLKLISLGVEVTGWFDNLKTPSPSRACQRE